MALTDEGGNGFYMPVAPAYGYGNGGGFGNGFGGDGWWILLLLLAFGGGWGMGGFGGGFGGYGNMMLGYDFPWLLNGQQGINNNVSDGFRDAQLHDSVTSVRDGVNALATQLCGCCGDIQMGLSNGFAGVQQSLCNGFAGTTAAVTGAQNAITQQMYTNQIADLNRSFAAQTATVQGFNGVSTGIADLKYTVATENCADRAALSDGIRDIIAANNAGIQSIKDQLCQYRNDQKDDTIAQLRQELIFARGQASQDVQTAAIKAGQVAEIDALYNRLSQCPVNTVPVYGNTPIWTCTQNVANGYNGCGCGCNG